MIDLKKYLLLGAILWLGLAEALRISRRASELSDAFKGRDVNKTIAKVEAILARNPALPRLTRGEILALFENITKSDAAKIRDQEPLKTMVEDKNRPEQEKSLMVVLPFKADSDETKGLEELYTRQPVTRIVGYSTTTSPLPTTAATNTTERPKRKKKRKNGTRRKPENQEIRPVYVGGERTTTTISPPAGEDFQWNPIFGNEERPSVKKQNANSGNIEVPNYMKDTLDTFQNSNNHVFVTLPTQKPTTIAQSATTPPSQNSSPLPNISIAAQSLTPELKNLLVSLGLLNPDGSQVSSPLTTTTTTHAPPPLIQYISINPTVDPASYIVFKPLPLANSRGNHRGNNDEALSEDMRHFLASFGLTSDTESFRSQKALDSGNRLRKSSTTTSTTTIKPSSSEETISEMQSDDSGLPDINTDILTDDMKDVLENIGLVKKSRRKSKGVIFNPAMRTAGLLNQSEEKEKVDKLLSTIKELSAAEKNKSLSAEEVAEQLQNITASLVDETREENSSELELVEGEGSEMNYEGYEPAEEELLKLQNGFIDEDLKDDFPVETVEVDNNGNNSNNELAPDTSSNTKSPSLKDSPNPPDPLSIEELHHFVENNKNEVKRQQPNNTTETTADVSSTTESSSVSESSSDEPKSNSDSSDLTSPDTSSSDSSSSSDSAVSAAGDSTSDQDDSTPSQDDLIDSFGGDNPPQNRPNGLYFLVDWNTFLRVGTDNRTVDLNFSPKVGDPKNFLPVTVP